MRNSEVAHIWANQTKQSARTSNGNFSFDGPSLFSYRTEIARIIEGAVVYTTKKYSVTTSSKHQNQIWRATSHLTSYATDHPMSDVPTGRWYIVAAWLLPQYEMSIEKQIADLPKAKYISGAVDRIQVTADKIATLYRSSYQGNKTPANIARLTENAIETLKHAYGIDIDTLIQKRETAEQKRNAKKIVASAALRAKWKTGGGRTDFEPLALRIAPGTANPTIETSRGIRIAAYPTGLAFWQALTMGIVKPGDRIEEYTVTSVTADYVKIGCHTIPRAEIEEIATALGFSLEVLPFQAKR